MGVTMSKPGENLGTAIFEAARMLAVEHGSAFTTQDVIKRAGVSLQTFYRYYGGKDQLILALIGQWIRDHCDGLVTRTADFEDPVERLECYVRATLQPLDAPETIAGAQFVTNEHWRLHQKFPREIWEATQPFTDLLRDELVLAKQTGQLSPRDPDKAAWLMTKTILGAYHQQAFLPDALGDIADDVWEFCLAAVGGQSNGAR
jgi:TetR/AcrR family transcriptional regulator